MKTLFFVLAITAISATAKSQTTWYEIPTGTDKKLNTIDFPTPAVGYIGGNDSLLLKTIDGGKTWNQLNYTGVNFYPGGENIINLKFVSAQIGYLAAGPYGGIYKTIDGGSTWTAMTPAGVLCFSGGLYFFDENNGFFGGSGCFQGETIEKLVGGTMTTTTINTATWLAENRVVDFDFLNANFGLAASYSGYILRTTDGGSTWDTIPTGQPDLVPLTSVVIYNDTIAYAGYDDLGTGFGILRTIDGGLTWQQDLSSVTFYYPAYLSVHKSGDNTIYSGTSSSTAGVIFESPGYESWNFYPVDHPIYDMSSYGDSVVFGVGDSGYVVVNRPPSTLQVESKKDWTTGEVVIFPNPTKGQITLQLPNSVNADLITISIFNLVGELVYKNNGVNLSIDLSMLKAGIYLVQINSELESYTTRIIIE